MSLNFAPTPRGETTMARVFERTRHFGLMLVLAIIATFTVAIPSANAATVSTVFPESGPNVGGTPVTLVGEGFGVSGTPTVTVGGANATSVVRKSNTELTFVTPAGSGPSDIVVTLPAGVDTVTVPDGFTYDSHLITPAVETINPASGGQTGGELITITGHNLQYVTSLTVGTSGGIPWENFVSRDAAEGKFISFMSPYQTTVGAKEITLYGGAQTVTEFAGYTANAPAITKITPNSGSTSATSAVVIDGVGFASSGTVGVTVGGVPATGVQRVSPTQIKATFPTNTAGAKDVVVTIFNALTAPSTVTATRESGFLYIVGSSAPTFAAVTPARGVVAGGNTVTITGTNLRGTDGNAAEITFDGIPATNVVISVDRKSATVTVPAHAAGAVTVAVETIDGRAAKPTAYTYAAVPTITSISPSSGVVPGGTLITINGTNFGTGTPIVTVGGAPAICTRLVSPTVIEAVTPAGSAGAVNVSVDPGTGSGTATSAGAFSYVAPMTTPAISSISPNTGLVTGGTNITITTAGAFPTGTPVVLVGTGCATNVTRVSSTVITATTPAGTVGAQNVSVTFATAHSSNLSSFTYTAAPAITTIAPVRGGTTGGTNVTITGVGFGNTGTPAVTFGGVSATNIVRVNDSTITATTPASSAGAKTVVVTPASAAAITRASAFTYDLPAITSITPNSGVVTGGNKVTIVGTGFGDTGTPTVLVNGTTATNIVRVSSTQITATVPSGVTGLATFNVTPTTGTGAAINSTLFTYMPKRVTPLVTSSSPTWVAEAGNTLVYITGSNFRGSDGQIATVTMGGVAVTDLVVSADGTSMSFRTPALGAGYYAVRVGTNEGIVSHSYHRVASPPGFGGGGGVVCDAVSPRNWTPAGGTSVTITGTGFAAEFGAPRVSISGVDATVTAYTDTSITFLDPGGNLGTFDIDIVLSNAVETTLSDCGSRLGYSVITAQDKTINFGATTPTFTRTVTGMVGSDALTGLTYTFEGKNGTSYGPSTTAPTAAGEYRIIPSDAAVTPGPSSNYTFNYVEGTYTINGIDATVTAAARTIQYGDATPTFSSSATGLISGHSLTGATYKFVGTGGTIYPESTTAPTGVGTYSVVPSDATVTGGAQTNYFFTYVGATFTITARAITVTADAKTKTYGDNDPTLTFSVTTGTLAGSDSLAGSLGRAEGENVGTYAINIGELSEYNPNYNITFVSRDLVITRKTISVVADPQTKGFGDSDPELTYSSSGLIGGDSLSGSMSRAPGSAVGTYAISQGTLTGGGNYTISSFTGANLTITAKTIQLTVNDQSVIYGNANPANTFSLTDGSFNGSDSISSLTYTYSTSQFDAGQYTISGATPVFSSGSAANYVIEIVPGTLTVERRSITLSAADKTKTYGNEDPELTYTVSSGTLASGDTISGSLSRESGNAVGTYSITPGTVSAGDNYDVIVSNGTLTITQRPITVTADAKSKTYGDSDPTPSWQVTTGSLAYSDTLDGSLGRVDGENVGTYAYNIGELGEYNPSYDITFVSRNLTVTRKTISVTLDDQSKSYGDNDPEFTYSSSGLLGGDQLTGSPTRVSGQNVGTYSITTGTLSGGGNYTISGVTPGTLTIEPRPITLLVDNKSMTYGDSSPSNSFELVEGTFAGSDAISSLTYSYSSAQLDAGSYSISGASPVFSSGSAANYTITINPGTLTVDTRTVTVTADNKLKQYGDNDPTFTYVVTPGGLVNGDTLSGSLERNSGEDRGNYNITAGSLSAGSNYSVVVNGGMLEITQREVEITADSKTKTYGDSDPTPTWVLTGGTFAFGGTLAGALGRASGEGVGTYTYTLGEVGEYNPNYDITFVSDDLTIEAREISVVIDDQSISYGDNDPQYTFTAAGFVDGDSLNGSVTREPGTNVGTYIISEGTLSGGSNYVITSVTSGVLTIDPLDVTITAEDKGMTYGESAPGNTYVSSVPLVGSDAIASVDYTYSNTPNFAGQFDIIPSNVTLSTGLVSNYNFTYVDGVLDVARANVEVTIGDETRAYGESDPAWTVSVTEGELYFGDALSGDAERDSGDGVGNYSIRQGTLDAGSNYNLTVVEGTLTITKVPLTVLADDNSKTYGDTDPELTFQAPGLLAGDELSGSVERVTGEDVDTYLIEQGTLDNANYDITFVDGVFTIDPKNIVISIANDTKQYGEVDPAFTASSTDLVGSDTLTGDPARDEGENVGSYNITIGTVTAGSNYTVTSVSDGLLTIDPRPITVAADSADKIFGESDPVGFSYEITEGSLIGSDAPTGSVVRDEGEDVGVYTIDASGLDFGINYSATYVSANFDIDPRELVIDPTDETKGYGSADPIFGYALASGELQGADQLSGALGRQSGESVGFYTINAGTLSAGSNYTITVGEATLEITRGALTVTAGAMSKAYGEDDPELTWSLTSGTLGESDELTGELSRAAGEDVGTYAINLGTLGNANYEITFIPADLTITAKTIAVTLDDQVKTYGDEDPTLSASSDDLVEGDSLTGTPSRASGESANDYSITQGSVTAGPNYNIVTFTPGIFTIDPRPITVTMDDASKDYGTADPGSWSYDVTSGNLVNSDTATGAGTRTFGANAGTYPISEGTLSFGSNYDVTFVPGTFTIDPIDIELTAADKSKEFGATDPAFTYDISSGDLVGGDTLSGSLSRDPGEAVGTYAITAGTISGGSNYNVTVIGGSLEITAVAITVTATDETKAFGDDDPDLGWDVTSGALVAGHDLTGELSRASGETVGDYAISQGTLGNSTYDITFVGATLEITRKSITVTVDSQEKVYGESDPELTYSADGLVGGYDLSGDLTRASGENVGARAISQGTLSGGANYTISTFNGASLTITQRPITLTVADQAMEFGGTLPSNSFDVSGDGLAYSDAISGLTYSYDSPVSNAGTYVITGSSPAFTTGTAANYDVTFVDGELTVYPKPLTYTLADETIGWGEAIPTFDGTTADLVGSDAIGTVSFTFDGSSTEPITTGTFEVGGEIQTFSSGSASNYVVIVVPATLTVTGPQYLTFTPDEGFVTGGMPFEIRGSGFGFDNPTVEFDGLAATDVVLVDSNTITGLTPEHAEGLVDVVVTTTEGAETLTGVYTYIPLPPSPEISTMYPPLGPTVGGTLVTFTGANLRDTAGNPAQVTFDGLAGTDEAVSEDGTSLTVRTPPHIVETVDVEVSTDTGIITLPQAYEYYDGPVGDVSGKLWIDANFDGLYQETEAALPNMAIALIRQGDLEPQFGPESSPLQTFGARVSAASTIPGMSSGPRTLPTDVVYFWAGYTDSEGNYTVPALPYGNYVLVYTLPADFQETVGGGTPGAIQIILSTPELQQDLAGAGFSNLVSNRVVYMESGEPVPFADVLLVWSASDGELGTDDDVKLPVTTDANGEFVFGGLSSGLYDVMTYEDDPMVAMSKPVPLGSYVTETGGVWEIFERPIDEPGDGDGELAETGFGAGSMSLYALGVFAAGLALAVIRRTRVRVTQ